MEHLWSPWRIEYIRLAKSGEEQGCILCDKPNEQDDTENLILARGDYNFVIMNRYPYIAGHLMVAPLRHTALLEDLSPEELLEHFQLVQKCIRALRSVWNPGGFNMGMNMGRVAGAGVDQHIHTHIVPRWAGDTNFMPVIASTGVVNSSLKETYLELKPYF
ncbi:MAG: HIT domain-containing protein [Dehalococcoidales bacterium]|jgi:ATP adenylyltransferase|nr:HIT domain-containing protein [Dehalococcoidales bacterium]MDD5604486.1 HIT domain-containing protein [Dehalococcoidales bacterium]MDX9985861.1 HIT domain-containing protein [Dehalococcoidales bacterium]